MDLKKSKTQIDETSFDEELGSLNLDDTSFLDDSDPAIPIVNDVSDPEKKGDMSFDDFLEDSNFSLSESKDSDSTSDFDVNLNDFSHAKSHDEMNFLDNSFDRSQVSSEAETSANPSETHIESDDEEPIALSQDELDHVLDNTDLDIPAIEDFNETMPEDFTSAVPETGIENEFSMPEMSLEEPEEDIALSDDELDNILGDTDTSKVIDAPMETEDNLLSDEFDRDFFGDDALAFSDEKNHELIDTDFLDFTAKHEDEIMESADDSLRDSELDSDFVGGEFPGSILEDEDEGPIALTPEELGNIESDVSDNEILTGDIASTSILDEDDEGPISFDESEMAKILQDVTEEEAIPNDNIASQLPYGVDLDELDAHVAPVTESLSGTDLKKEEMKKMISYLDSLFDELPEETVRKFSNSEYFELYKKIMKDLGIQS